MKFGLKTLAVLIALGLAAMPITSAFAETRVALHATQEEINIWKQRRLSGPYLEDWNRILSNANSFKSSPSQGLWLGNQSTTVAWVGTAVESCSRLPTVYPNGSSSDCNGNYRGAEKARDAGFVWLVTGDTAARDAVIAMILNQITKSGTDFSNTTRWPRSYVNQDQDFAISIWARELAYAYSYVRASMTGPQQSSVDSWFNDMGSWLDQMNHNSAVTRYPNRRTTGDFAFGAKSCSSLSDGPLTHSGGFVPTQWGYSWDNKAMNHNAAVAAIGAVTGNATLLAGAKRMVKEWLHANVYSDGIVWDVRRWFVSQTPQSGWSYLTAVTGSVITAVDHLARTGDTELYTYSTSAGNNCSGTASSAGGPKSLLKVLHKIANMALGKTINYASLTSTTDPAKVIRPQAPSGSPHYIYEIAMAQANVFYKDTLIQQAYNRTKTSISGAGYNVWGGDWGNMPGALFMFGQMEGKVWPYSTGSETVVGSVPLAPTNLTTD